MKCIIAVLTSGYIFIATNRNAVSLCKCGLVYFTRSVIRNLLYKRPGISCLLYPFLQAMSLVSWTTKPHNFSSPVATISAVQGQPCYMHPSPYSLTPPDIGLPPIPQKNEQELTREALLQILDHFSQLIFVNFAGRPIRLVVHGGACMLLHEGLYKLSLQQHQMSPNLPRRTTTRDVDYIHRSFVAEMAASGMADAAARLAECVKGTARKFGLGLDWMNSDADIALPYAFE
jgi:hypothetical protein